MDCQIGAVLDSHRCVRQYNPKEQCNLIKWAGQCGWNFSNVEEYFSSGVLYVKDTNLVRLFYKKWYEYYCLSTSAGVYYDQISLERTKQDYQIIQYIPDVWNTIMYIRPKFIDQAKIIHFTSLDNNSFLFSKRVLRYIRENGLTPYVKYYIRYPMESYVPYMKKYYKGVEIFKTICMVARGAKQYAQCIDDNFVDLKIPLRIGKLVKRMYSFKMYYTATVLWILWIRFTGKYNQLENYYE